MVLSPAPLTVGERLRADLGRELEIRDRAAARVGVLSAAVERLNDAEVMGEEALVVTQAGGQ